MNAVKLLLVAVLAGTIGLWGCREDTEVADERGPSTTTEDLSRRAGEAVGSTADYLAEKKNAVIASAEEHLKELEESFETMKERGSETADQGDKRLQDLQVEVRQRLAQARGKLKELRAASAGAWEKTASELGETMSDLGVAYDNFVQAYKSERQPPATVDAAEV